MNAQEIINEISMLDSSQRKEFAQKLRKSSEAWNAVNGLGGSSDGTVLNGMIIGTVVEDGAAIEGAIVELEREGVELQQAETDDTGGFTFDLEPDIYNITVRKPSYYDTVINDIEVYPEEDTVIEVEMTRNNQ